MYINIDYSDINKYGFIVYYWYRVPSIGGPHTQDRAFVPIEMFGNKKGRNIVVTDDSCSPRATFDIVLKGLSTFWSWF